MQGRAAEARQRTLERVQDLGLPVPPAHLPVLEDNEFPLSARGIEAVIQRALVLNVRINLAFGMPPESARTGSPPTASWAPLARANRRS